jgi:ParB family chromosome partitioning protein
MAQFMVKPSLSQAQRLKKAGQDGSLTLNMIESILSEQKKASDKAAPAITIYKQFFPKGYTSEQMDAVIVELLTGWRNQAAS